MPDIMKMNLCANWLGSLSRGHVTVECTAYKGIAQPLKKRTVGQTNIAHVYDGTNHIWPTSVIHFSDFTSVQLRYIWGSDDGRDLDTKSYYVNSPINSLNYVAVGWSWNLVS